MHVFVTGGTGLIGRQIVRRLLERGDQPVVLSRRADEVRRDRSLRKVRVVQGDPNVAGGWEAAVDGCDAVINLAGQNLFAKRWNAEVKRQIRDSRVYATEHVIGAIEKARSRPKVLVQASAIGYYGPRGDERLTEDSPPGSDFMAVVSREWEEAALAAQSLDVRLATIRTGVVLAKGEGALGFMAPIFQWLPGGAAPVGGGGNPLKPGKGQQWVSWIHLDDIVGLFLMALDRPEAEGPINGTAPNPERNYDFSKALSKVLWKPWPFLPFGPPDLALETVLGEVAKVVTQGQRVLPEKALKLGYTFAYPDLADALRAVFAKPKPAPEREPATPAHSHGHH